jgi:N-acetylglucosamine-6-sulfatase
MKHKLQVKLTSFRVAICSILISGSLFGTSKLNGESEKSDAAKKSPNILFILTDDQALTDLSAMPILQEVLVKRGTSFDHYFANVSLCCPSRAAILRGQVSDHNKIYANGPASEGGFEKFYALHEESSTIATWLQDAGYQTLLTGKYLNRYPETASEDYIPPGWSDWSSPVKGEKYTEYNYTLNESGKMVEHGEAPEDYGTDVYYAKAESFIRKTVKNEKPFFVYFSTFAPHGPATPAPRHKDLFPNEKALRSPNFNEPDVGDKPGYIRNLPLLSDTVINKIDSLHRKRFQSLQAVDEAIGKFIKLLEETHQLNNTYIVFASDNGLHLGNHRQPNGKQSPYEEDFHLPLIVRGPGVPEGKITSHIVGNIDLAPTFAEWAGVQIPNFVDGRSMACLLKNNPTSQENWRKIYLFAHGNLNESLAPEPIHSAGTDEEKDFGAGIPPYRGLRTQNFVYIEYQTKERELYNIEKDPYELVNISSASENRGLVKELSNRLADLYQSAGDQFRRIENKSLSQ